MVWPFTRKMEAKANPVGASIVMAGGPQFSAWTSPQTYIKEGYQLNPVVYRAIKEITRAAADCEIELHKGDDIVENHPVMDMLARPNPTQGFDGFIVEAFTNFLITGEMAVARSPDTGKPAELWSLSPVYLTVEPGQGGLPREYVYEQNGKKVRFPVDRLTGRSPLFFMKMYNPSDYWRGQSPLVAAGLAADTHNAGMRWNYSLLRNSARPSGLIKLGEGAGGEIVARIKEWFKASFQGERAAGEIPILPSGAEWQAMDTSPRDMDFANTQKEAAKLIASAFGVPLPLIDNDASTFNNLEQAKERFYTDTVLPMMREFLSQFGAWLLPQYGIDGMRFEINEDKIGALEGIRTRLFDRMIRSVGAGVLTADEAREAMGYDPLGQSVTVEDVQRGMTLIAYGKD